MDAKCPAAAVLAPCQTRTPPWLLDSFAPGLNFLSKLLKLPPATTTVLLHSAMLFPHFNLQILKLCGP